MLLPNVAEQVTDVPAQAPLQWSKAQPASGLALMLSTAPAGADPEQFAPQMTTVELTGIGEEHPLLLQDIFPITIVPEPDLYNEYVYEVPVGVCDEA